MAQELPFPALKGRPTIAVGDRVRLSAGRDLGDGVVDARLNAEGTITTIDAEANCFWLDGDLIFGEEVSSLRILAPADASEQVA